MKLSSRLLALSLCLATLPTFAGTTTTDATSSTSDTSGEASPTLSYEFDAEESYIGDSDVIRGRRSVRDFDENNALVRFIFTPRIRIGILRLGVSYERYDFGISDFAQLPDTLQAANLIVGLDTELSDSFLIRIEAQPGFYSAEDLKGGDFNVPFVIGGTYIYSPNLQFVFGVGVDFNGRYPVLPGGGIRWRMSSQWVLNAVLPTPRLEFEATKNLTVYVGADIRSTTYRVNEHFGEDRRPVRLNDAVLSYSEVRTGIGIDWKVTSGMKITAEAGYLPYRSFDYHRADIRYRSDGGAPYGMFALHAAF
ncbi:MAG: DUF6268 family outer membrane beta-barrel protein [Chthoniobacterales bacterium]